MWNLHIITIINLFKFVRYNTKFFFLNINFFFKKGNKNKNKIMLCIFGHLGFFFKNFKYKFILKYSKHTLKKKILFNLILKKKQSLFSQFNTLKRSLFYSTYKLIKEQRLLFNKKNKWKFRQNRELFTKSAKFTFLKFRNFRTISFKKKNKINIYKYNKYFKKRKKTPLRLKKALKVLMYKNKFSRYTKSRRLFLRINKKYNKQLFVNRQIIKEIFFNKFTKQHIITKFLQKLSNQKNYNSAVKSQMFLYFILLNCQMFLFKSDVFFFIKTFGVYINGVKCKNEFRVLNPNDVIQVPVINTFFFFFKKTRFLTEYFFKRYQKKFYKLSLTWGISNKKRSYTMPNFLNKLLHYRTDIPNNFEVDFSSLIIVILYNTNIFLNSHWIYKNYFSTFLVKLYNWRKLA